MDDLKRFVHPDWDWTATDNRIESECSDHACKNDAWYKASLEWLSVLSGALGDAYKVEESKYFILLSSEEKSYAKSVLDFSDRALNYINNSLGDVANDCVYGKRVIIIIHTNELYQSYVEAFRPELEGNVLSCGEYIDLGYEHSLFPYQDLAVTEPILVGHLVGGALSHLPLPIWLLEGVRSETINQMTGYDNIVLNEGLVKRHKEFWESNNIEEFWSGDSFDSLGDSCPFSMELARILVRAIIKLDANRENFLKFVKNADYQDAGESAFYSVYGMNLRSVYNVFLGDL